MRIALISDIHEDIINLQLALQKIDKLKCEEIICLGDISGYSAKHHNYMDLRNATESLRLIRENCSLIIAGNHDLHAAHRVPQTSEFEYPANWYELDYWQRHKLSKDKVWLYEQDELQPLYTQEDIEFINHLQESSVTHYEKLNVLYSHYLAPNLTGSEKAFYHSADEFSQHRLFMENLGAQLSFTGHRHFAGVMINSGKSVITRGFGREITLKEGDIVHIPPITRANNSGGFLFFDVNKRKVQAVKV
jgi:predicted phosphodiesterase